MSKNKANVTALYERLSRDDEQFGDSSSIVNQKEMLESYAKDNGYTHIRHYTDDGYSGGSFDRPGWQRMIEDIEKGEISTVIAKDMSRIGRNYLEVGYYTEVYFGQKNIRFIAISNNVDSENQASSEFAPFLNIMNEWYLKDCSKKIKASKRILGNSGVHLSPQPCYGYLKDPNDKHKWIVDEEAAEVVRLIYQLCIEGNGTTRIVKILRERKIESPAYHAAKMGLGRFKNELNSLEPYNWNDGTIRAILSRPEYLGYTINFKTRSKSYKEHKNILNNPKDWAVFENTQEPIVDLYTYQLVQKLRQTPRRHDTLGTPNPLTGLVFCADCGAKMYNHRSKPSVNRHGKKEPGYDGYDCSTYKLSYRKSSETVCKSHYISTKALREIIRYTIEGACRSAVTDREAFAQKVMAESEARKLQESTDGKRQYDENKRRFQELDTLYTKLYESYAKDLISEDRFVSMSASYEAEQAKLKTKITEFEQQQSEIRDASNDLERFYELVDRYTSFEKLTTRMINEFVDKVLVHKAEKIDGRRTQKVEVYLNYIGKIEIPEPKKDPEQEAIDEYWRDKYQRTREYELNRRKKFIAEANKVIEEREAKEREQFIREFDEEVKAVGLENMPIIPELEKNAV